MSQFKIHKSELDNSINYTLSYGKSMIECRFVQRDPSQIIAYVSSHNGCSMACRFCHLTQTGQTEMEDVTPQLFANQLKIILDDNVDKIIPNVRLNVNFMARGEPLKNQHILNDWPKISKQLLDIAEWRGISKHQVKFNISTIIPNDLTLTAKDIFGIDPNVWIYWSYYSHQMAFRKRWMPKAAVIDGCLKFIGNFPRVVVHGAFIEGENHLIDNLKKMLNEHPHWKMNIVRYNPYSDKQGTEASNIDEILKELTPYTETQIVPRVGFDVKASCGMFMK